MRAAGAAIDAGGDPSESGTRRRRPIAKHPNHKRKGCEMKAIRLIGSATGALLIALVLSTGAAHARTMSSGVPYCPDLAPLFGAYIGSTVSNGRYYDIYRVPNLLGFEFKWVACP
jgi:hypothetical protein